MSSRLRCLNLIFELLFEVCSWSLTSHNLTRHKTFERIFHFFSREISETSCHEWTLSCLYVLLSTYAKSSAAHTTIMSMMYEHLHSVFNINIVIPFIRHLSGTTIHWIICEDAKKFLFFACLKIADGKSEKNRALGENGSHKIDL